MSKNDRLALIRARATLICSVALPGLLTPSLAEVTEEQQIALSGSFEAGEKAALAQAEDEQEFGSTLAFDAVKISSESEDSILLSRAEKTFLAQEVQQYKLKQSLL
jgi:hypothetical protein